MRIQYIEKRFNKKSLQTIEQANSIIDEYTAMGLVVNLRQLYYQFVARGLRENSLKSYKNLGSLISEARLAGLVDWDSITDQLRHLRGNSHWRDGIDLIENAAAGFKLDKWENQNHRVEVWVEKDALLGILAGVCHDLDVDYFSCRGNNSQSGMWEAGMRLKGHMRQGYQPVVIYLGDHDPSGVDMTRDIEDRLQLFTGGGVDVQRIALNMDQVREYDPPPNPVKEKDSRTDGYKAKYGEECWELDALDPGVLSKLIRDKIGEYIDRDALAKQILREQRERRTIQHVAEIGKVVRNESGL